MSQFRNIIIVEDDQDLRDYLQISLEDKYNVYAVSSAREFKKKIKNFDADVFLFDLKLPDKNGDVLASEIKQKFKNNSPKVILMSAWDDVDQRAKKVGAEGFIRKPFTISKLQNLLEKVQSQTAE